MTDPLFVLQQFVERADVALALVDRDMRYLAVSQRWRTDFGLGLESLKGRSHYDVFPNTQSRVLHEHCLADGRAASNEERLTRPDGRVQWIAWRVQPWRAPDDAVRGLVLWSEDITARKAAEAAREVSEARYHRLAEQITDGVFVADAQGRYTDANQAACDMVGYSLAELRTLTLEALLDDAEIPRLPAQIDALRRGETVRNEWRFKRKDGSVFVGELIGTQLSDGRLQGVLRDVSERVQAGQAIHDLEAQHCVDAETLHALLSTSAQGILSIDEQGTVRMANLALESMLGWGPGELVGQPHEVLIPPAQRGRHAEHQAAYWDAPRARPMGAGLDLVAQRKDGSTIPVEISLAPIDTGQGRMVFGFVSDVSTRRREEEQQAVHARELERQAALLRRLASELTLAEQHAREDLARVLHDHLQQLLFSARLRLQRLSSRSGDRDPVDAELVDQTRRELDEAIATTRSFVAELFPPMLHGAGLAAALTWLQGWAREKYGLTITMSLDPSANPQARDIRTLVFESVKELVFNAAKHARTDQMQITLTRTAQGDMRLVVADGGSGFEPSEMLLPGRHSGTGFGLLAIRERLAGLGGRLDIDAAPGRGARFTLTAPCGIPPATLDGSAAASPDATAREAHAAQAGARPLRILLADDHALVRDGLRQLLSDHPALTVVGEASDGEQAFDLARDLRPDVIVMDVAMPRVDGVEATRRIHAAWPGITILGLSTQERPSGLHDIEEAGAAGYFTKGDDAQHLLDRLVRMQTGLHHRTTGGNPP